MKGNSVESQVKSKKRVADHGEVFTNVREVKAMCDLVFDECNRIESRFLEPACGNGNFLAEILSRKLAVCKRLYKKSSSDYEKYSFLAVSSIYGVELLNDNAEECRERLYKIWESDYKSVCKKEQNEDIKKAIRYLLDRNILCGNALSLMTVDENGNDTEQFIVFSEWSFVTETLVKRRDFRLDVLLRENEDNDLRLSIFDDDFKGSDLWEYDSASKAFIPKPIKEFKPIYYRRIFENE